MISITFGNCIVLWFRKLHFIKMHIKKQFNRLFQDILKNSFIKNVKK